MIDFVNHLLSSQSNLRILNRKYLYVSMTYPLYNIKLKSYLNLSFTSCHLTNSINKNNLPAGPLFSMSANFLTNIASLVDQHGIMLKQGQARARHATTCLLVLSRFLKTENRVSQYTKGQCFITVRNDSCIDT